jgi:hypothetical protein
MPVASAAPRIASAPALTLRGGIPPFTFPFFSTPQSENPVRVLLTAQNRATFLTASGAISDQTQASLPLASGAALNLIPPEPGGPLVLEPVGLDRQLPRISEVLQLFPELSSANTLAALLGQVDPATADFRGFNKTLAAAGVPVALEPRTVKAT